MDGANCNVTTNLTRGSTQWRHSRKITTLDPAKLTSDDYIDLSSRAIVYTMLSAHNYNPAHSACACISSFGWPNEMFPPDTRGFLYYRTPWGPPLAGELRFRLTPTPDPATFSTGSDLVTANGVPWNIPLYSIPLRMRYRSLQAQLLQDGLVSQHTFDLLTSTGGVGSNVSTRMVSAFGQEFRLGLSKSYCLLFVGADSTRKRTFQNTAGFKVGNSHYVLFEGDISVIFGHIAQAEMSYYPCRLRHVLF